MRAAAELATDRFAVARAVADAVLYEGYVLYPYRASSAKNQVRFQWGVLVPPAYAAMDSSERSRSRTECLLEREDDSPNSVLHVRLRCLQTQRRSVHRLRSGGWDESSGSSFAPVDALEVDGTTHVPWDEAVECVVDLPPLLLPHIHSDFGTTVETTFSLESGSESTLVHDAGGALVGRFERVRQAVDGVARVTVGAATPGSRFLKVTVDVENTSTWGGAAARREDAMSSSLVALHTMLATEGARFISLLDPPSAAASAVSACRSDGTYPVLVGDERTVLSSPIILYDHPEVAEQSPGDLYDALEIDEILALRVMTLTDAEKAEARGTDSRAAAIVDRCDGLSADVLSRLHGQMVPVQPDFPTYINPTENDPVDEVTEQAAPWWDPAADASVDPWSDSVRVGGTELRKGSAVRLCPSGRADAQDMFLEGQLGTVAGVFADVDGGHHLAVSLDGDPATAELEWQGRYLYFHPHEVEPVTGEHLQ